MPDITQDLIAPDDFANLLGTPEWEAQPLHERAMVFDLAEKESRQWMIQNGGADDPRMMQSYEEALPKLRALYRPTDEAIALSQQGPVMTAATSAWRALGDAGAATVGGAVKLLDAGAGMVGMPSAITRAGGGGVLDAIGDFTDAVRDESRNVYATNPDNKKAETIGSGIGQAAAILGTAGAGAMSLGAQAATKLPLAMGFLMGADQGIDTAEALGIESDAGKLGMGLGFGTIEGATEMLGGLGNKVFTDAILAGAKMTVKKALKTTAIEGVEEVIAGSAQDLVTRGVGELPSLADPNNPGHTQSGYELPKMDQAMLDRRGHEFLGGAAGGAVFSGVNAATSGGAVETAATPAPLPESMESIMGQRGMVLDERKPAMLLEGVKAADLPPEVAEGLTWVDTDVGAVGHLPEAFTPVEIRMLVRDPARRGRLLGYGVGSEPAQPDRLVIVQDSKGNPIVTAQADEATGQTVETSLGELAMDGQEVTVLPADQAGALENAGRPTNDEIFIDLSGPEYGPGKTNQAQAGQPPGQELAPTVAPDSAESGAAEVKPTRKFRMIYKPREDGVKDILEWMQGEGLSVERPPRIKKDRMGRATNSRGEHDGLKGLRASYPVHYRALTREGGYRVDQAAAIAFDQGMIPNADVDTFTAAIEAAIKQRAAIRGKIRAQERKIEREGDKELRQGKRRDAAFDKANTADAESQAIASEDLLPGMTLEVDGEPMTVLDVEYDEDGYWQGALLEDGERFGEQWIAAGEIVHADPGTVETPEQEMMTDDPFSLPEEPVFNLKAASEAELQEEQARTKQRAEIEQRQAAPLKGTAGEHGTPDMLDSTAGDMALFNQRPGGNGTVANMRKAQLPRRQTPAGPIRAPGELVTLKGIRDFLLGAAKMPRVGVGRYLGRALGIYKVKGEVIRQKMINDIPTLAHEVAHSIHYRTLSKDAAGPAETWGGRFDAELLPLGKGSSLKGYSREQVREEGVAEFMRLWLTDPAVARATAPGFSAHFEQEMGQRDPGMLDRLNKAQQMIADYIAQPDWIKAQAQIVFDPADQRPGIAWPEWMKGAYATWVNTLQPALNVLEEVGKMQPSLKKVADRVADWMENHRGGWQSKAHGDLFIMQTDLEGKPIGDSMQTILADLAPEDHRDFSTYLAAKRAQELNQRGITSGLEEARLTPAMMAHFEKRFEATRQKLLKFQDNALQMLVDSGLVSGEAARQMREANRDYVPFYRMYEGLSGTSTGGNAAGNSGGYVDTMSGVRRIKGSDLAIVDPLQSIMRNVYVFRKLAEQNHIGVQFFDLMKMLQGHGQFADEIAPKIKPRKTTHAEVVDKLIETGVIQSEADLPPGEDMTITLFEAIHRPDAKTGEVIVHKGGVPQHWEVKDPWLFKALKTADAQVLRIFQSNFVNALVIIPTKVVRLTSTVANPVFALRNWFRDQKSAGVYSQTGYVPFIDGLVGALKVIRNHPDYKDWVLSGGKFSGLNGSDRMYQSMVEELLPKDRSARAMMRGLMDPRHIQRMLKVTTDILDEAQRFEFTSLKSAAATAARPALKVLSYPGAVLEEATRVQEFSRARSQGKSTMEAANLSKAVSMNFARAGHMGRTLNMVIAFFNAGVQDLDMVFRQHTDPKRRGAVVMKGLLYITVPSLLCWALGKDDKEIQNLSDWRKTFFWNFNLGPLAQALGRPSFILSLPKPFLMGQIYGTTVEKCLDQATGRDPNGAKKAAWAIVENTAFHGDITDFIPTALKPLFNVAMNKDTFHEMPVVPENMSHLPKPMQATLTTSETAKAMGGATGQSPLVIDYLIRGYLPGLGRYASDVIDWTVTKLAGGGKANGPTRDLFEWQPFKSFVGTPYESSAFVNRFYEASNDMEDIMRYWKSQSTLMTTEEQQKWWAQSGKEVLHYSQTVNYDTGLTLAGQIRQYQKSMSEMNRAMKIVNVHPTMTPDQKRAYLIELAKTKNATAEAAFRLFPEVVRKRYY